MKNEVDYTALSTGVEPPPGEAFGAGKIRTGGTFVLSSRFGLAPTRVTTGFAPRRDP
jgi:hypothetical protein